MNFRNLNIRIITFHCKFYFISYPELRLNNDIEEAASLGINSVPFFVFNRKYAISGAQPTHLFSEVLEKSLSEFLENNSKINIVSEGDSCDVDGNNC